jgi:hypothetical protein
MSHTTDAIEHIIKHADIYEIPNTFTRDLSLDQQIALGISAWQMDCPSGHTYFGHTRFEVIANATAGRF